MSNPKKEYGATRYLGVPNYDAIKGEKVYKEELKKLSVKEDLSYFNPKNGGFLIWMEGHQHAEEGTNNNEYKLGKALADKGYWVYLLPEKDIDGAITLRINKKGSKTFVDTSVESLTGKALYEQWSPTKANDTYGILSGLQHASDKGCKLLAIYDPNNILNRGHVKTGMELYAKGIKEGTKNYIKLKGVITYNARNEFHTWYWED